MCTNLGLRLFGVPNIIIDGKEVTLRSKRSFGLIAYLHSEDKPVSRKDLVELLWASNNQPASGNLRVLLYQLHKLLPKSCLLYTSPSPRDRTRSRMPSSA